MEEIKPTPEQIAKLELDALKYERNRLLSLCDWTQLADVVLSNEAKQAWGQYRQQLRDLPTLYSRASQAVWPKAPE
jgi:hypothetical protein